MKHSSFFFAMAGCCLLLTGCSVTVGGPHGSSPSSGSPKTLGAKPSLGEHPSRKNIADLVAWYRRNGYTVSDAHEVDAPDGKVKAFSCSIQKETAGEVSIEHIAFYANIAKQRLAEVPPQVPPISPPVSGVPPPAPPSPTAIPDAGSSGLTVTLTSTHSDVDRWLAYYRSAGYRITDSRAEYFPTEKIKFFHCEVTKPVLLGSKAIKITVDGVHRNVSVSNTVGSTIKL